MDRSQQSQSNYNAYASASQNDQAQRIDLNSTQAPDFRKRNDLKKRLYDSGISNVPMPSVKRPIEEKISANPFSARMNSSKIQCLSPLKKKIQELNTNIIENLNATYEEAKVQAAKYEGEGTEDYYRSQNIVVPNPSFVKPSQAGRKLQGTMGVTTQPRLTSQLLNNRKTSQIQPLDSDYQSRVEEKLKKELAVTDPQKIMAGPPSLVYAGFEGSASLSQKNLELARSKFLLDKITGKLPKELRQGSGAFKQTDDTKSQHSASQSSIRKTEKQAEKPKPEIETGHESVDKKTEPKVWSDLDKYIELLLDSKSEEETVFMYLNPNLQNGDPYDLQVISYDKRYIPKYYTLSGKGLTLYENDTPVEFISLGQWLIERDSYNHIKELSFFKQFKKWKFMRMWKKTIKQTNRSKAQNSLDEKLFILQDFFGPHLFKHRSLMIEMQNSLKFVDVCQTGDVKTIAQFAEAQENKRNKCEEEIKVCSNKSRANIQTCILSVLESLRGRIISEITLDEQRSKHNPIQSSNTVGMKRKEPNNAFEKLNFPSGMTYGHRSSLRKECSRFLRFAYLVDFISLEALANIYKNSVEDMINRLYYLDAHAAEKLPDIMKMEFDDAAGSGQAQRGYEPLFHLNVILNDQKQIPEDEIGKVPIDDFILPPRGTSQEQDFDLKAHLELEPIKADDEEEEEAADGADVEIVQLYRQTLPNVHNFWIKMEPDKQDFKNQIQQDFQKGLDKIACFTRWSKHGDLKMYADALEEWDDIVGDKWDEPDEKALALNPLTWISDQKFFITKESRVNEVIDNSYSKACTFLARFQPILEIYWRNKKFDINILVEERLKNAVENLANVMKLFKYYQQHFQANLPSCTDIGLLQLDSKAIKSKLQPTPKEFNDEIEKLIPDVNKKRTNQAKEWLSASISLLKEEPQNVEEFVVQQGHLNVIDNKFQFIRDKVDLIGQFYGVLQEHALNKPRKEDLNNHTEANQQIAALNQKISQLQQQQESQSDKFKKALNELIPNLNKAIDELQKESVNPHFYAVASMEPEKMAEIISSLDAKMELYKQYESTSERYNDWQNKLYVPTTNFENLDELRTNLVNRHLLWHSLDEWTTMTGEWKRSNFGSIDAPSIQKLAEKYAKICKRVEGALEPNPIQQKLRHLVEQFEAAMPIVMALRNPDLQEHHWAEIREMIGQDLNINEDGFTLQSLIDMNVVQFMEQIVAKSVEATGQAKLLGQLRDLQDIWKGVQFTTKNYKEKDNQFILVDIDTLYQYLDEGLAQINMILGNRFVKVMRKEAEIVKKELNTLDEAVKQWVEVQRQWCYLENIFAGGTIKQYLPEAAKRFDSVNKFYTQLTQKANRNPQCLKMIRNSPTLVENLIKQNQDLELIQSELDVYVEEKRKVFPRFYFLSFEDLIQILSNSENKDVISLHLKTLFDGIVALEFKDENITKMFSKEKEVVELSKPIKTTRQPVEVWLLNLTEGMKETVYRKLKEGYKVYSDDTRKDWVLQQPGQVVASVAQIQWCANTSLAIDEMQEDRLALQTWFDRNDRQIEQLTIHVRSNLTDLQRCVIVALITTDVHARDIVEDLKREQVTSQNDFTWQKQLRYYYDEELPQVCKVQQIQATLNYGGEYMGATSRLVITPLTDRCWITITGALHIKLGANPAGPAGTGKTESTKDLAKAIAILCIVFNCSDQVDFILMYTLFSGLCQAGAWACLDEFNRIKVDVLSVVAQQLLQIRLALLALIPRDKNEAKEIAGEKQTFKFEDKVIPITPEFGCHITMNPGYAGRTELPDNLKVLFRPVAMMIPDYGLIAEIMLGSEGFSNAKILSKKMVQLYKLSSEQLSQQDHYDFGMRAVKSVLVMAGALKRANPDINEDAVLIRAMRDANVPKFLKDDLPLFAAIIQDLFPTVQIVDPDYSMLLKQIEASTRELGFQPQASFMQKVIFLYETFNVRFGVMLVGPTGGGKTTCYEVLAHVMTTLRNANHPDKSFQIVNKKIFNPKAISMGELYGEVDFQSQEWTDGLASKIMRMASQEQSEEKSWTIFDGPVDAIWIENMNTVLDDNMTLCLSNGQRIKLRPQMRMLFEVMDLAVASPATVSRCGMVYLTAEALGWIPFFDSWIQRKFPDESILKNDEKIHITETFHATIDMGVEKIRGSLNEPIKTDNLQLVKSVCSFLEVFFNPELGFNQTDPKLRKKDIDSILGFSYTWGMGAALDERSKDYFDSLVRDMFKGAQFPQGGTVFDYYYDLRKGKVWNPWENQVQKFEYVKDMSFFDMMVPTADTYKHRYCLEQLLSVQKPVFITGLTGVGKSVTVMNTIQILSVVKEESTVKPLIGININFSAQTDSKRVQQSIEEKLEKSRTAFSAPPGKRVAIFIDDINMPQVEEYGAQPPIELLRLLIDKSGMFDRKEWEWKSINGCTIVAAAAPPSGGRAVLTPRFTTHFNVMCMPQATQGVLAKIFSSILDGYLKGNNYQEGPSSCSLAIIDSTIEIYQKISEELRATPAKFHYMFNLRDVSKVIQGILMSHPKSIQTADTMQRLWANEVSRVFGDRLINVEDTKWFTDITLEMLNRSFRSALEFNDLFGERKVIFSDILKIDAAVRLYENVTDIPKLNKTLTNYLEEYNLSSSVKMNLVFFEDAVLHLMKILRALRQPRGNIMLIGVGGSGKQSLIKLGSYIYQMEFKQIEIVKGYDVKSFREFVKEMMFQSGVQGKPIAFTMTDSQILSETFLEDLNNVLNTGEIPNLMQPDDKDRMQNELRTVITDPKKVETNDLCNQLFIERVREYFHICLCMSPVGDDLRVRCRNFPSLVNCCTLDWFSRWPEEALLYVSRAFLKNLELPSDEVRENLAVMCMVIHTSVEEISAKFFDELRRRVYTTPKSYLDLISLYLNTLGKKRNQISQNRNRLANGLTTLKNTNASIAELKVTITKMLPELAKANEELAVTLVQVNKDKAIADEKDKVVSAEKEIVEASAAETKIVKDEADGALQQALPILEKAKSIVDALDKNSIVELKALNNPPPAVEMVMSCVMTMLGEKDVKWDVIKSVHIKEPAAFIKRVQQFRVEDMSEKLLKMIRTKWFALPEYNFENVSKKSVPAGALCQWSKALSSYYDVHKQIVPMKEKAAEMDRKLNESLAILKKKMDELNIVKANVAALVANANRLEAEKNELEFRMKRDQARMGRAEKLVVLLADEAVRWKETVEILDQDLFELVGNVFLSCACISYFGAFTGVYRKVLTQNWNTICREKKIPCSEIFNLVKVMGDPVVIRGWCIDGLPTDQTSAENGILTTGAERWGLCIDPQQQANKWIKNMYKKEKMGMLKFGASTFLREVSAAVNNGYPILVEDVQESIDPGLDPILMHSEFMGDGGIKQIKLGEATQDYDDNFRLFMTTKMPNPHYPPEVCIKVTLINFTVTFEGLEEQLLGDVVIKEKPEVEAQRDKIVIQMSEDKKTLKNIENRILKMLTESTEEQILDEDTLINVLDDSKITSTEINTRIADATVVEQTINETRAGYKSIAVRGSIIYFVIADMAQINDMYQNALQFVKSLFNKAIDASAQGDGTQESRLENLIKTITSMIFTNISRGLFERDKLIFSFLICTSIDRNSGKIQPVSWNLLLRGTATISENDKKKQPPNPLAKNILTDLAADLVWSAEVVCPDSYGGLTQSFKDNEAVWLEWATCEKPQIDPLPLDWNSKLTDFEKLILLKAFRPEKLAFAFQIYVLNNMGKFFIESQSATMEVVYADTDYKTPLIFILSTGADPTEMLQKFARAKSYSERLKTISLGQGQGEKAVRLINEAIKTGDWVMLQNCHLAEDWMPELEKIVNNFQEIKDYEPDFRLFLTSMPASYFPVSVLQNGVKLTTEPPRGIKANLKRGFLEMSDEYLDGCIKKKEWRKLIFGLSFFHAIVQERRKFGPLGWNILYEFNDSDLETSLVMLKLFLDEGDDSIPWEALVYVTGHINYGGRVTDDNDRRCLLVTLQKYYCPENLEDGYTYSDSGSYYAPAFGNIQSYRDYIETLPLQDGPEVFGLHENANISYQKQESDNTVATVLSIQSRISSGEGGLTPDQVVLAKVKQLLDELPAILDRDLGKKEQFKQTNGLLPSLTTVLVQEMEKFNRMLKVIRNSLNDLEKAIHGFIVMSETLDKMYLALQNGQVPGNWAKVAYPSLKPLASWYLDLQERVRFMDDWLQNGTPKSYWISGLFFPQGFMTGVLQTHSRQYKIPIDKLQFGFTILEAETIDEVDEAPEDGVYVHGFYLDGARYNRDEAVIDDQIPGELYNKMPLIWFKPQEDYVRDPEEYACPCYKTGKRAGVLSTTGQSTNFIIHVDMPTKVQPATWTRRAAAMLCQLND